MIIQVAWQVPGQSGSRCLLESVCVGIPVVCCLFLWPLPASPALVFHSLGHWLTGASMHLFEQDSAAQHAATAFCAGWAWGLAPGHAVSMDSWPRNALAPNL